MTPKQEAPKLPARPAHTSSFPTLPVSAARKPARTQRSFKFSTVLEGKSSDTDSYGGAKASRGLSPPQVHSHDKKHQRWDGPPQILWMS